MRTYDYYLITTDKHRQIQKLFGKKQTPIFYPPVNLFQALVKKVSDELLVRQATHSAIDYTKHIKHPRFKHKVSMILTQAEAAMCKVAGLLDVFFIGMNQADIEYIKKWMMEYKRNYDFAEWHLYYGGASGSIKDQATMKRYRHCYNRIIKRLYKIKFPTKS